MVKILWGSNHPRHKIHYGWMKDNGTYCCICGEICPRKIAECVEEVTCSNCLRELKKGGEDAIRKGNMSKGN